MRVRKTIKWSELLIKEQKLETCHFVQMSMIG